VVYGDLSVGVNFDKTRDSGFSYKCAACNNCCKAKAIRVGPYEILRLAQHLKLTTTAFIAAHTQSGGTVLRTDEHGDCGFLGPTGCTVHPHRPLACRLYPLGMIVEPDGTEKFGALVPHPQSRGNYGQSGTVGDYLAQQGVAPFIAANQIYEQLYNFLVLSLQRVAPEELENRQASRSAADQLGVGSLVSLWTDIDATLLNNHPDLSADAETTVQYHVAEIRRLVNLILVDEPEPQQ
jgi:uncharacterized protein